MGELYLVAKSTSVEGPILQGPGATNKHSLGPLANKLASLGLHGVSTALQIIHKV